jgi:hypothetical protein
MRQEHVVVLRQEPDRHSEICIGDHAILDIEQLAASLVTEGPQARAQPLDDLAQPREP